MARLRPLTRLVMLLALSAGAAWAADAANHTDPVTPVLFQLVVLLVAAKLGGSLAVSLKQPAVLGELLAGVVLGNIGLIFGKGGALGAFVTDVTSSGHPIDILARLGVVLLLFKVGLESDVGTMVRLGLPSIMVATIGVVVPFFVGWGISAWLLPGEHDPMVFVFIGATLCATSVGITARVLQDLNQLHRDESRIILGAAVVDDVMGLVVLAVVASLITAQNSGQPIAFLGIVRLVVVALGFLLVSVLAGRWLSPRVFSLASRLRGGGLLLITSLAICFLLAAMAGWIGLAPIVGAFAAGLLLEEVHYQEIAEAEGLQHGLEDRLAPLTDVLVPLFFVQMGMTVHLEHFAERGVIGFALALTLAAILGKQACGLGVNKRLDRLSIGIGMVPRGEVGLIFAAIGRSLHVHGERVVNDIANSAVVIMVMLTTMVTPPLLSLSLKRSARAGSPPLEETTTGEPQAVDAPGAE